MPRLLSARSLAADTRSIRLSEAVQRQGQPSEMIDNGVGTGEAVRGEVQGST